ncbi:MAG: hypothetical protein GFH27_549321n67 [Chloroflexi bacterium AL-W]|nr:hypothetical protein [Chloroflexi bacterium AL-N1]NOK64945.1 hypothetical protein [Chloroflexi bacterium AL-N10]NOK76715.1 hypothetical protein [Chloroflexi bacterium AL-N5]NOK84606.1 hypothetical protein [Chloroflexi bacterium AL-W]NOK86569.1 hypothetical protein [Chloroflexi bacterium AL-N15]
MARTTPSVHDDTLVWQTNNTRTVVIVGTSEWYAWLDTISTFAFSSEQGSFTARKERRQRGGWYWKAYRKRAGKLYRCYLGKTEELSQDRLINAVQTLNERSTKTADTQSQTLLQPTNVDYRYHDHFITRVQSHTMTANYHDVLLITKSTIPPLRQDIVPRKRLHTKLDQAITTKLTLVVAPAGYGKTTLLTEWITAWEKHADVTSVRPQITWLSLDESDNDPRRFWMYVAAAFAHIQPDIGHKVMTLLQSPQMRSIETILATLMNDLAASQQAIALVLDDYHLISTPEIHQTLTYFVERLPINVQLIIASRTEPPLPLARFRARREVTEIGGTDLRCTYDEAASLLHLVLHTELDTQDIRVLVNRTEGWMAGLQLAALSLQSSVDTATQLASLQGNDRYIWDYLIEEVLQQQSADVQRFLLHTSILDRLNVSLCDAVMGDQWERKAASGHASIKSGMSMLDYLERTNLFTIPLDNERRWYRYHHLFSDVLRTRLQTVDPAIMPTLHRRAAHWYEEHGLVTEAIHHALAAADYPHAGQLIEQIAQTMLMHGEVVTLVRWLKEMPEATMSPRLYLSRAWIAMLYGNMDRIENWTNLAEQALSTSVPPDGPNQMQAEIATLRSFVSLVNLDFPRVHQFVNEALASLPENDLFTHAVLTMNMGLSHILNNNDTETANTMLVEAIRVSERHGNIVIAASSLCQLAELQIYQGKLREADAGYDHALQLAVNQEQFLLPIASLAYIGKGQILRERNHVSAAKQHVIHGLELDKQWGKLGAFDGYIALAYINQALGDTVGTTEAVRQAIEIAESHISSYAIDVIRALEAKLILQQGDVTAAAALVDTYLLSDDHLKYVHEWWLQVAARVRVAQGQHNVALEILGPLLESMEQRGWMGSVINLRITQALAFEAQGEIPQALVALTKALELAEPEGYVRTFLDEGAPMHMLLQKALEQGITPHYVRRLLHAFDTSDVTNMPQTAAATTATPTDFEPLSDREREVLTLIADGRSVPEIAQLFVVAPSTIKTHVKHIYRKLDVHNRVQAVARAREYGILA